jgi:hypothetical protein
MSRSEVFDRYPTNFLNALSGNFQLQIGLFTGTALVKEMHYLLLVQV